MQQPVRWLAVVGPVLGLVGVVVLVGNRQQGHRRALALAGGTGICSASRERCRSPCSPSSTADGLDAWAAVASWELYALLVMAVASVALQQVAFQAADLAASQPAITVLTPLSGALCGIAIFGERLDTAAWEWVVVAAAVLAMAYATIALARSSASGPAIRPAITAPTVPPEPGPPGTTSPPGDALPTRRPPPPDALPTRRPLSTPGPPATTGTGS